MRAPTDAGKVTRFMAALGAEAFERKVQAFVDKVVVP